MKEYIFKGDWSFDIYLPEFSKLHSIKWFASENKTKLENGFVPFRICDERTYETDPTSQQIRAIEYLLKNEKQIITSLFQAFKHEINKFYVDVWREDDWIPELNTVEDLGKLIGIYNIIVLTNHKDNISYIEIDFAYLGDEEHGLAVVIHMERLVGYSGIGDMGYECIYKDLGLDETKVFEDMLEQRHIGENVVHKSLEKFGKFKPWQLTSTEDYFSKLLRERKNQQLIDELETNKWDINIRFPLLNKNLVDIAAYSNNVEMLDYLINKGGDYSNSILQCISYGFYHPESIRFLVSKGASIDTHGYWGKTPLCNELENFVRVVFGKEEYRNKDQKRYEKAIEDYEMHKQKILFYLKLGANPNLLDKEGNNYKGYVSKLWNENYISKFKVVEQIEELIFTDK
jgi:hypothetical protein